MYQVSITPTPDFTSPPDSQPWGGISLQADGRRLEIGPPWPWVGELTTQEFDLVRNMPDKLICDTEMGEEAPDDTTIRVYTVARRAKDQGLKRIGPAAVIKAAAVLGIVLKDRNSEVTVTQAEDILTQLKGE